MGEQIKQTGNEMRERWQKKMPRFFHRLMVLAIGIGVTAAAINFGAPLLGATLSEWWSEVYSHLISGCIGVAIASKFTCDGGFREKSIKQFTNKTILDKDDN
jgi:hypothetical protein